LKIINRRQIRVKVLQELYSFNAGNYSSISDGENNIKNSLTQTNSLYLFYLFFLKSLWEFSNYRDNYQKKLKKSIKPIDQNYTLVSDLIPLKLISTNKNLISKINPRETVFWDNKQDFLNGFFCKIVESEGFKEYTMLEKKDYTSQLNLFIYIFKEILVFDKKFYSYIEDQNIYWVDDVPLVNSFLLRLIKTFKTKKEFNLLKKSFLNTEKDVEFALKLFKKVLENSKSLDKDIQKIIFNWDIKRVAIIDKILIKMSISELIYFSEIPKTVSINEYLEISKEYSTPKSSQFINGVLDSMIKNNQ